jgi:glycosyltransferase involved in cell wall biosynthesis
VNAVEQAPPADIGQRGDVLKRLRLSVRDRIAFSPAASLGMGIKGLLKAQFGRGAQRVDALCGAVRRLPQGSLLRVASRHLRECIDHDADHVIAAHHAAQMRRELSPALTRTTVLKAPGADGERGVIYCQFEYNWGRLMEGVGPLAPLLRDYDVIWGASWSPLEYLALARVLATSDGPVYVHPANLGEIARIEALHPRVRVIPQLAGEFQDPEAASSLPAEQRDIDLLVVSNWAPFKRHWDLFDALRDMPADLCIVLVGQPESGHGMDDIRELMRLYRVPQQIELRQSIPLDEVHRLQSRSKASAVFSRREGQCIAAVEALFAGASLGLRRDAMIGSAAYINDQTGLLLDPAHMARDLMRLIQGASSRDPRRWAVEHLGRDQATARLNAWLRKQAEERGLPWTRDIERHWWCPYPWVGDAASRERLAPAAADLHARHPDTFRADLLDSSRL